MSDPEYPELFLARLRAVSGKRARIVVTHILENGFITTEDLEGYGYKHPPRAVRDVREQGIPIETFQTKNAQGKTIAAYRFGDPQQVTEGRIGGRRGFSKAFKALLLQTYGTQCAICSQHFEQRYLQVDHRIPYEIAGDESDEHVAHFMLLCGSCNRAKSWSCEHCANWQQQKDPALCRSCYWASPSNYKHVALEALRRVDLTWSGDEVTVYDHLLRLAKTSGLPLSEYLKQQLRGLMPDDEPDFE